VTEYCRIPEVPWPTVRLWQAAAVTSIVTVVPFAIVTASADVGTVPEDQVEVALQLPVAMLVMAVASAAATLASANRNASARTRSGLVARASVRWASVRWARSRVMRDEGREGWALTMVGSIKAVGLMAHTGQGALSASGPVSG
jgi:hypothetical protein